MKISTEFPKGCRIIPTEGCVRGLEDGFPWDTDRKVVKGRSLGFEHRTGGRGGMVWLAV